jgi:ABC transporter DrrB family efflux protein
MSDRRAAALSPLAQLTRVRMISFLREPEAVFWVFAFPVLMALALGIAFRNTGPPRSRVGVLEGPGAAAMVKALAASPDLEVIRVKANEVESALGRGRITVLVRPDPSGPPVLESDPVRAESRLAQLATAEALERAAGRRDVVGARLEARMRAGSRYIDFLIPGLIGLNLLGTGMWGIGFPIATSRQQKLLKRMLSTPMRRSDYLLSHMLARLVWLVMEVVAVLGFGMLAFGVQVRGPWLAFALVTLLGAFSFSALGLLVASRARTIEAVSGLMNVTMLPMWLLSGSFFSADRFPTAMQWFVQALPLTAVNNALRAIMNEGAGLAAVLAPVGIIVTWGVAGFFAALALFRWE